MNRVNVESSNVRSVGYESSNSILEVEFHSGGIYQYLRVPSRIYDGLMNATSKGRFLNQNIKKPGFAYKQIK